MRTPKRLYAVVSRRGWFPQTMALPAGAKPSARLADRLAGLYTAHDNSPTDVDFKRGRTLVGTYVDDDDAWLRVF
jgi:hypothetical protein